MKKVFTFFFVIILITFSASTEDFSNRNQTNLNLLTARTFPHNSIENLKIETTYENLEIIESYGSDLSLELYGNNNKLLPEIITTENSLTITSTPKKTTPGDICKIIIYIPADSIFTNFYVKTGIKTKGSIDLVNLKSDILNIETYNFDVNCSFFKGKIVIKTISGNVSIDNISSKNCGIFTKNGHISVKNAEIQQFSTISDSGNIKINNLAGEYFLGKNNSGNIFSNNISCDYFDINTIEGDTSLSLNNAPVGSSNIKSEKGFIQCFIPDQDSFTLVVHSTKGTFLNKLDKTRQTPRHQFRKDYNNGGAELSIKTFSGNIEVDKY